MRRGLYHLNNVVLSYRLNALKWLNCVFSRKSQVCMQSVTHTSSSDRVRNKGVNHDGPWKLRVDNQINARLIWLGSWVMRLTKCKLNQKTAWRISKWEFSKRSTLLLKQEWQQIKSKCARWLKRGSLVRDALCTQSVHEFRPIIDNRKRDNWLA